MTRAEASRDLSCPASEESGVVGLGNTASGKQGESPYVAAEASDSTAENKIAQLNCHVLN